MSIIKEWEITVSITRQLRYSTEDNESKEGFIQWLKSLNAKSIIQRDFIKGLRCYSYIKNADMIIEDIELKETEVKSTDIDPRV